MTHKIQIDDLVRDATPQEIEEIEAREAETAAKAEAAAAKIAAKASAESKLAALGLTADEIAALKQ
jgi:hypothetical protein